MTDEVLPAVGRAEDPPQGGCAPTTGTVPGRAATTELADRRERLRGEVRRNRRSRGRRGGRRGIARRGRRGRAGVRARGRRMRGAPRRRGRVAVRRRGVVRVDEHDRNDGGHDRGRRQERQRLGAATRLPRAARACAGAGTAQRGPASPQPLVRATLGQRGQLLLDPIQIVVHVDRRAGSNSQLLSHPRQPAAHALADQQLRAPQLARESNPRDSRSTSAGAGTRLARGRGSVVLRTRRSGRCALHTAARGGLYVGAPLAADHPGSTHPRSARPRPRARSAALASHRSHDLHRSVSADRRSRS